MSTTAMCNTFKQEILSGIHFWTPHTRTGSSAIGADTYKIAMFTSSATTDKDTTGYVATNEVTDSDGVYSAGGAALTSVTSTLSSDTAFLDFADTTWASSSISNARSAVIYNSTLSSAGTGSTVNHAAYPSVCSLDFGGDKSSSSGDFTIQYPANGSSTAIIRIT